MLSCTLWGHNNEATEKLISKKHDIIITSYMYLDYNQLLLMLLRRGHINNLRQEEGNTASRLIITPTC